MNTDTMTLSVGHSLLVLYRYYIKNNRTQEPPIPDELIGQLLLESQISLQQLTPQELAWQLTLNDYRIFREIEPTEYVDDLDPKRESKYGTAQLQKFEKVRSLLHSPYLIFAVDCLAAKVVIPQINDKNI